MKIVYQLCIGMIVFTSCQEKPADHEISADETAIRDARNRSNKAIAEKDTVVIDEVWMENFLLISSRDSKIEGRGANRTLFINEFKTKPDVIYVRTPSAIQVMEKWNMAAENGTWVGSWTADGNKIQIGGSYYAKWHKVNGHWLLRVEVFTPQYCDGGPYCETQPVNN